jgi:SET domain-containing protein
MNKTVYSYMSPKLEERYKPAVNGMGVFAVKAIPKGELLALWGGHIIPASEVSPDMPNLRGVLQVEDEHFVFAPTSESADLFNHSCSPNAGFSGQISLVAMKDIEAGAEVCFDYAMCDGSDYDEFDCACGGENCRGRVTGNDWQIKELWERYQRYFSPYLQRRIDKLRAELSAFEQEGSLPAGE